MTPKNIATETASPGIRIVRIARPKFLNALNSDTLKELKNALNEAANDPKVRLVILTGEGEKSFIAGADISEMKEKNPVDGVRFAQLGHEVTKLLELMPKPTIAAVNGYALGGGTEMAIACDFIVASDNATFGQPEVGLGIIPGFGATLRLSKFVGIPKAKELIFSGARIKAQEALELGLVNHVFPSEGFMDQVLKLAKTIARQSLPAIVRAKHLLNEFGESTGLNSKLDAEAQAFGQFFGTHDQREGMAAFVEKRPPSFEGLR